MSGARRLLSHPVARNLAALSWMQLATFVVPLVTLPYLGRVLTPDTFGLVVLAQGLAIFIHIVVDFGFQFAATREIAAAGEDPQRHARVAADVLSGKLALVAATALGAALVTVGIGELRDHPEFALLAWVAGVANGLAPVFFFLGIERMGVTAALQLVARVVAAGLTFVLVRGPGDAWIVVALYAACSVAATSAVFALAHRRMPLLAPSLRAAGPALRRTVTLFAMQGTLALYATANVLLLGLVAGAAQVAHFGAAERVVRAGTMLLATASTAVYPRLSALIGGGDVAGARRLATRLALGAGAAGLAGAIVLALAAAPIVRLVFGPGYEEAADVMRLLALILPLGAVTGVLGGGLLLSLRLERSMLRIALTAAVVNVVLGLLLGTRFGPVGMAASVVVAEVVALTGCVAALRRLAGGAAVQAMPVSSAS